MKKPLLFIVLSLLNFNSLFAEEVKINLLCKYENNYYRNWDQKEFGRISIYDDAQKSIKFTIIKSEDDYYFDTTYKSIDWSWTSNAVFTNLVTDSEYSFLFVDAVKKKYKSIKLNRFDGSMFFLTGNTEDDNKYQFKVNYKCEKVEQKF